MKSIAVGFALAAVLLAIFFAGSANYQIEDGPDAPAYAADFVPDYVGAWIVRKGDRSRLYDPGYHEPLQHDRAVLGFEWDTSKIYPLLYPPFYYAALTPLAAYDYRGAAHRWAAILVLAWLAAAGLAFHGRRDAWPWAVWALPASILFGPFSENLASGQKGTILLLLFAATFALWSRGHRLSAGLVFGLVAFKPHLGVALGLMALWKREWRFAVGAGLSVGALLVASLAVDPSFPSSWLEAMTAPAAESGRYFHFVARNQCWFGFAELLLGTDRPTAVGVLTAVMDTATAAFLLRLWRGPLEPGTPRFALQFAGAILATVLVSHHAITYDLTILLLPLALLFWVAQRHPGTVGHRAAWLRGGVLALFVLAGYGPQIAGRVPLHLGVLAMFAVLAWISVSVGRAPAQALGSEGAAQTSAL